MARFTQPFIKTPNYSALRGDAAANRVQDALAKAINPIAQQLRNIPNYTLNAPDGGTVDVTSQIMSQLASDNTVILPPGNYLVTNLLVGSGQHLHLMQDAQLLTPTKIVVAGSSAMLTGDLAGENYDPGFTGSNFNVCWTGSGAGPIIQFGLDGTLNLGSVLQGLAITGQNLGSALGIKMGSTFGSTWCTINDVSIRNCPGGGLSVFRGVQSCFFNRIYTMMDTPTNSAPAIDIGGPGSPGGNTVLHFNQGKWDGYGTAVRCGGTGVGESGGIVTFTDIVFEEPLGSGAISILLNQGGPYDFFGCFNEGPGGNTCTMMQVGADTANNTVINGVNLFGGLYSGYNLALDLYGFRGLSCFGSTFDLSGQPNQVMIRNNATANGKVKLFAEWFPGLVRMGPSATEFLGAGGANGTDGFDLLRSFAYYNPLGGDTGYHTYFRPGTHYPRLAVANNSVSNLFPVGPRGRLHTASDNNNGTQFWLTGLNTVPGVQMELANALSTGNWSDTKDTAGKLNVYVDTTQSPNMIVVQSSAAGNRKVNWWFEDLGEQGT